MTEDAVRDQRDALWALLDDIDTLDDSCREFDAEFRERVRAVQKKRWDILHPDEPPELAAKRAEYNRCLEQRFVEAIAAEKACAAAYEAIVRVTALQQKVWPEGSPEHASAAKARLLATICASLAQGASVRVSAYR